jgi:hypothetical protein
MLLLDTLAFLQKKKPIHAAGGQVQIWIDGDFQNTSSSSRLETVTSTYGKAQLAVDPVRCAFVHARGQLRSIFLACSCIRGMDGWREGGAARNLVTCWQV